MKTQTCKVYITNNQVHLKFIDLLINKQNGIIKFNHMF